ncbi:MAG: hypothetical protein AABX96_02390 [Nanoarchaeota archaeon]
MTIRYKRPDNKNAMSIVKAAKEEMDFALSINIHDKSGSTIIRNIYESFRMLGDSLLVYKGFESKDHTDCIKELINLKVKTQRPLGILDNIRILRHNINYYGYRPKLDEVKEIISIAKSLFNPIYGEVLSKISN